MKTKSELDDVRRRVRFDADADLRLIQAVHDREPFAAEHGMKLKAWDDVADVVYASANKLRDVPSSRRAVTDRFNLLLQMYEHGTLKLKRWADAAGGTERCELVESLMHAITERIRDVKENRGHKQPRYSLGSESTGMSPAMKKFKRGGEELGHASSLSTLAASMIARHEHENRGLGGAEGLGHSTDAAADELDNHHEGHEVAEDEGPEDGEEPLGADDGAVASEPALSSKRSTALPLKHRMTRDPTGLSSDRMSAAFLQQLVALKQEKLALKRRKLELLERHHRERLALERHHIELLEQRTSQPSPVIPKHPSETLLTPAKQQQQHEQQQHLV